MMNSYDLLTGFQAAAAVALSIYAAYFQKERHCMPFVIILPYILFLLWGGVIIYYFSMFLALSVLWFLLGGLVGLAVAAYCSRYFPDLQVHKHDSALQCPPLLLAPAAVFLAVLLFGGIQGAVYYIPFLTHFWLFNELLGFIPGVFLGILWGRILSMLAKAQLAGSEMDMDDAVQQDGRCERG